MFIQTRTAHITHTRITCAHTPPPHTHRHPPSHHSPGVLPHGQVGSFGSRSSCGSCASRSPSADPVTRPVPGGLADRALPRGPAGLRSHARSPRAPALTVADAPTSTAGPSRHAPSPVLWSKAVAAGVSVSGISSLTFAGWSQLLCNDLPGDTTCPLSVRFLSISFSTRGGVLHVQVCWDCSVLQ